MTELAELIDAVASLETLAVAVLVFGFAPGFVLRMIVKIYPRDDPRRRELVAELYLIGRFERLFFVAEQFETVLFEGVPVRCKAFARWVPPRLRRIRGWLSGDGIFLIAAIVGTLAALADLLYINKDFDYYMLMGPFSLTFGTILKFVAKVRAARSKKA